MDDTLISVTLAARNFSDCINLVRYKGASFILEKNGVPVARIVPVDHKSTADLDQLAVTSRSNPLVALSDPEKERPPGKSIQDEGVGKRDLETAKLTKRRILNW
jgi:antitoxin (DNA-binding transcriptional repressor) of toxin-antitoxin stability system